VIYNGPDARFAGREICVNSATEDLGGPLSPDRFRSTLQVVDVTDKGAPVLLGEDDHGTTSIGNNAYTEGD
jgi:hypothetical protein